jgi:hypothetical protein
MTAMMAALFFLFQFSAIVREEWNDYEVNEYEDPADQPQTASDAWFPSPGQGRYAVFVGASGSGSGLLAREWCTYTKRALVAVASLEQWEYRREAPPDVLLLDGASMNWERDVPLLWQYARQGLSLVFCSLPVASVLGEYPDLQSLLGIRAILSPNVALEGITLYEGFLLGGRTLYTADGEDEEKRQDLDLEIPWYLVGSGTKSYMVGQVPEEVLDQIETTGDAGWRGRLLPPILWRNSIGAARIFAVNGAYLETSAGLGILSALVSQIASYDLYPIINAQNTVLLNFPELAPEREEAMEEFYGRSQKEVFRDIIWPDLVAIIGHNGAKVSCMLTPQLDYGDWAEPDADSLLYYMKSFREEHVETGLSASRLPDTEASVKIKQDGAFWQSQLPAYTLLSFSVGEGEASLEEAREALREPFLRNVRTLLKDYEENEPPVSYFQEEVTLQSVTHNGSVYTYSDDLRLKSLETALGYSTIAIDLLRVADPQSQEDSWENVREPISANTYTYWRPFRDFEQTTLARSDRKIREFLALDYSHSREGNTVLLEIRQFRAGASFLLRTQEEEVEAVKGAQLCEIEDGAYLVTAQEARVELTLRQRKRPYYH